MRSLITHWWEVDPTGFRLTGNKLFNPIGTVKDSNGTTYNINEKGQITRTSLKRRNGKILITKKYKKDVERQKQQKV